MTENFSRGNELPQWAREQFQELLDKYAFLLDENEALRAYIEDKERPLLVETKYLIKQHEQDYHPEPGV